MCSTYTHRGRERKPCAKWLPPAMEHALCRLYWFRMTLKMATHKEYLGDEYRCSLTQCNHNSTMRHYSDRFVRFAKMTCSIESAPTEIYFKVAIKMLAFLQEGWWNSLFMAMETHVQHHTVAYCIKSYSHHSMKPKWDFPNTPNDHNRVQIFYNPRSTNN